jgi:HK97 family phage prohead protease
MLAIERRINRLEVRSRTVQFNSGSCGRLGGYACRWATNSGILEGYIERLAPMCFTRSLANGADVRALINHNPDLLIARRSSKALRLNEDAYGLAFDMDVAPTSYGKNLMTLVDRGDLTSMSFAFVAGDTDWDWTDDPDTGERVPLRTIRSAEIQDISCVTYPAYPTTSVGVRDFDDDDEEPDEDDPDKELDYSSSRHPLFNADPTTMDPLSAMSPRSLFPNGIPLEIRSHVPNFKPVVRTQQRSVQERRRRLTSLFL